MQSHFKFSKQERSGIFFLLLLIVVIQVAYVAMNSFSFKNTDSSFSADKETQARMAILKEKVLVADSVGLYPFNPNFISDYKGYALGMSSEEIDRLHTFRSKNKYVNSVLEFQMVTQVSDSLLAALSPYFKFPEWTKKRKRPKKSELAKSSTFSNTERRTAKNTEIRDLNAATAEELRVINGIGPVLSKRIIKYRDLLGGFVIEEQLYDVYGLEPEIADRVLAAFKLFKKPLVQKININSAKADEIGSVVHITYTLAQNIVDYREANGPYSTLNELKNIDGFPSEKINRIAVYLSLKN